MYRIGLAVMLIVVAGCVACAPTSKLKEPGAPDPNVLESTENARVYHARYEPTFRAALDALRQVDNTAAKLVKRSEGLIIFKKPGDAGSVTVKVTRASEEATRVEISAISRRKYRLDTLDEETRDRFFSKLEKLLGIAASGEAGAEEDVLPGQSGEEPALAEADRARVLSYLKQWLRLEGEQSFLDDLSYDDLVILERRVESLSAITTEKDRLTRRCSACYIDLARVYHDDARYNRAAEALEIALSIDPESAVVRCNLGEIYKHLGLYKKAVHELEEASRLDPEYADTYINLGIIYDDFLLDSYRKYIDLGGEDEQALVWIKELEGAKGSSDK